MYVTIGVSIPTRLEIAENFLRNKFGPDFVNVKGLTKGAGKPGDNTMFYRRFGMVLSSSYSRPYLTEVFRGSKYELL